VDKLLLDAKQIEYKIFDVRHVEGITTEFVVDIATGPFIYYVSTFLGLLEPPLPPYISTFLVL
jgi:hypothetical protein